VAVAQDIGNPARGRAVAVDLCAGCHAVFPREASPNPDAPAFDRVADTPGMSALALGAFLRSSHRTMPNLIVPTEHASDLIAYILSLASR
jgi:hypothetical protein